MAQTIFVLGFISLLTLCNFSYKKINILILGDIKRIYLNTLGLSAAYCCFVQRSLASSICTPRKESQTSLLWPVVGFISLPLIFRISVVVVNISIRDIFTSGSIFCIPCLSRREHIGIRGEMTVRSKGTSRLRSDSLIGDFLVYFHRLHLVFCTSCECCTCSCRKQKILFHNMIFILLIFSLFR